MKSDAKRPLVYSCSGASSAAQMANHIAVKLDRFKVADMSCIAGLGGDVKPLVRTAKSGRPIIAVDGCPLQCAAQILKRHGLQAEKHYVLSDLEVEKRIHEDFDPTEAARVLQHILDDPEFPGHAIQSGGQFSATFSAPDDGATARSVDSASDAEDEPREYASSPCYLHQFKD